MTTRTQDVSVRTFRVGIRALLHEEYLITVTPGINESELISRIDPKELRQCTAPETSKTEDVRLLSVEEVQL